MRFLNTLILLGVFACSVGTVRADGDSIPTTEAGAARAALAAAPRPLGIEAVQGEKLAEAVGHYARARSLLLAAIREFDSGKRIATPDVLIDSAEWRAALIDRATELEKVLDPQPKLTNGGVRYNPDTRLLSEANR